MKKQEVINAQTPIDFTGMTIATPAKTAAGVKAVTNSFKHVFGAMNVFRGVKTLLALNQKGGIDCPSCAWPDPDGERSSIAEYCENGAKSIAEEATTLKLGPVFFQRYSVAELSQKSDYWLGQQGRLTHPMVIKEGKTHYEKISWEEATTLIADELNALPSPNDGIFYTSGRASNEAAFLYQLFVRQFGTNNLPDCSNMCHESSGSALSQTLGLGKGSVTLDDFNKAEVIMILGQNPGTNHPRMLTALEEAKKAGAKIISVNPLIETGLLAFQHPQNVSDMISGGTSLTDIYLQIKINSDLALLKAMAILLYEAEKNNPNTVFDHQFIQENTANYELFIGDLKNYQLDDLVAECGISLTQIKEATNLLIQHNRIIVCWAMGLTQHKNSVITIQEVVNILLLKGSIGKEGAGTCPVRGHSNVQGDRTMGIFERPNDAFLDKLDENFDFKSPREHGFDVVNAIKAMHNDSGKVFVALGGNFLSATPDTEFTAKALQNCQLTVHISTKLNRSHLIHGKKAIILPCLGRTDEDIQASGKQFVSTENSMGVVQQSKGILTPPADTVWSEPAIVAKIAKATLQDKSKVDWEKLISNYDFIRELIEKTIDGFDDYNALVRQEGGFYLPNAPRNGKFTTKNQKANFTVCPFIPLKMKKDEFLMMTIRTHDQFNTTIYGLNDRYRGIFNERRVILMNEKDIESEGFKPYQIVDLHNTFGGIHRKAEHFIIVPYNIPSKNVATYFPEANVLVPIDSVADVSNTPTSKSVVIKITAMLSAGDKQPIYAQINENRR
ncbi:molybdopterin-dependent oxidoreductase alpha subunit [Arcicella aurantiaca]|uniref:Molybdopterin-dependent oxidoreductase alpha subunit n=1 Tax=Arcicella aurantiaca TaxID=591202 RepID=A0A316EEJ3_9BACT|nr:FdhF/YdeP family oxidoreductase [Arcicella aurantiaca]PWK27089.1 molybdopterin-dependent oxidoreductase alpha subunit [Arcicella aurantiaca]